MATSAAEKRRLLERLSQVDRQAASLTLLRQQIHEAVSQVDSAIAGTATGYDRKVLDQLQRNLDELDRSIELMRSAVIEGRNFAARVPE
ncbi:hypothetical protein [Cryptosporangium aurantiacum]|uniref:Uncharacterized protein n=1 Tax=Cryptosporangium aurantiacum TaxID=134849 RepID=A0A1M7RL04_9ACTN|nr:hypothetical protein [Cryptosporangium aurantiacum]SHN46820.1 hypothetical protein SAMN05443668_11852 [Cryptosporangium aurantiacum]